MKRSQSTSCSETQRSRTHPIRLNAMRSWPIITQYSWHCQKESRIPLKALLSGHSDQIILQNCFINASIFCLSSLSLFSFSRSYTLGSCWDDKGLGIAGKGKLATGVRSDGKAVANSYESLLRLGKSGQAWSCSWDPTEILRPGSNPIQASLFQTQEHCH